jgi:uncharacterized protein
MTVASIGRLWHYPVKSMQGEEVDQILLGPGGVAGDRAYGFVDVDTGRLASAKQPKRFGALLDCHARFLTAPTEDGMPPIEVTFPDGTVVRTDGDDGAELARRTAELLGRQVRLITAEPDRLGLVDLAPMHVLATSTLRRLADEHPDGNWDPRRMRPNILIDDRDGQRDEDEWLGCDVHLGDEAVVHVVVPTPRCVMTTLAQPGLPKDAAVLKAIARVGLKQLGALGQFACAGCYVDVVTPGVVRRGDRIRLQRVQPRRTALAATIDTMAAAAVAGN